MSAALSLVASGCFGLGAQTRTVFVDFSHDQFSSYFLRDFPKQVSIRPGDTLVFKQAWTGEPHTVTGGRLVDNMMQTARTFYNFFDIYDALRQEGVKIPDPRNPPSGSFADFVSAINRTAGRVFSSLPFASTENSAGGEEFAQNVSQPCYLRTGAPPSDPNMPCAARQQKQPLFTGKQDYYNSGIIPYNGPQGNTYTVRFSQHVKPGTYFFYCAVHGPVMSTQVDVLPKNEPIPTQAAVNRRAKHEIDALAGPLLTTYEQAKNGSVGVATPDGQTTVTGNFAGLTNPGIDEAGVNEFLPRTIHAKAGSPITWTMFGKHTISFGTPGYFPIMKFGRDGTVSRNPQLDPPAGGAPDVPRQETPGVVTVDGGTYDGNGFWSSGLISAQPYLVYTLRITRPGTYQFSCLVHPAMLGTVVVS